MPTDVLRWTTSSNLHIESYSDYSVEVSGYNSGSGTITATFYNGQTFTRNVTVKGVPTFHLNQSKHLTQNYYHLNLVPDYSSFSDQNVYNISWEEIGYGCGSIQYSSSFTNSLLCSTDYYCTPNTCTRTIKVRATNSCGTTENIYNVGYGGLGPADKTASINNNFYKIYPNPATNIVNIDLKNQDLKPEINSIINAQLFNMMGEIKGNIAITNNIASINTIGLPRGIYVLKINVNGIIESHQVAIE